MDVTMPSRRPVVSIRLRLSHPFAAFLGMGSKRLAAPPPVPGPPSPIPKPTMKLMHSIRGLALVLVAALATTAQAVSVPVITQGNNGPTGTLSSSGVFTVPSACVISSYIQITTSSYGGASSSVSRAGVSVLSIGTGAGAAGTYTASGSSSPQPRGSFDYWQGFGGPPNTVTGYVETVFSW